MVSVRIANAMPKTPIALAPSSPFIALSPFTPPEAHAAHLRTSRCKKINVVRHMNAAAGVILFSPNIGYFLSYDSESTATLSCLLLSTGAEVETY